MWSCGRRNIKQDEWTMLDGANKSHCGSIIARLIHESRLRLIKSRAGAAVLINIATEADVNISATFIISHSWAICLIKNNFVLRQEANEHVFPLKAFMSLFALAKRRRQPFDERWNAPLTDFRSSLWCFSTTPGLLLSYKRFFLFNNSQHHKMKSSADWHSSFGSVNVDDF